MSNIIIEKVTSKAKRKLFARFGNTLYKDNEFYVPDLEMDIMSSFDEKENAALEFCDYQLFLAYKDGEVAGRIAALINHKANEKWNVRNVRFGWIEFIDDREVSAALLKAAEDWGREHGMTHCQGPMGFTDFDKEGMLVEGFDKLSSMNTIYNHPYYPEHLEALGYGKEADWVQIRVRVPKEIPEKFARVASFAQKRYGLHIRKLTSEDIFKKGYGKKVFELLNDAYAPLFGFVEITQEQIDKFVNLYFKLINLQLVTVVETSDGQVVGAAITMGSLSHAMRASKGKLLPFGWWPLLRSLKWKTEDTVDMLLIAVKPELQGRGVNALFFTDLIPIYNKFGFVWAETGPQLETNMKELSQWDILNPTYPKRRRCYVKSI